MRRSNLNYNIILLINEGAITYENLEEFSDELKERVRFFIERYERGIIFHTGSNKEVFEQIIKNPKAELCFSANGTQIRVTGMLERVFDELLRAEIFAHPTRQFLHLPAWTESGMDRTLEIFAIKNCTAVTWTMETNFAEKKPVVLCVNN